MGIFSSAPAKAPNCWKVSGGSAHGGLVVRSGSSTSSDALPERLSAGTTLAEVQVRGERLEFRKLAGRGPESGWVSTSACGTSLLTRHQPQVWVLCAGTRGDLQPFLALSLGLRRAGFRVAVWSCDDYRDFVESYGLPFFGLLQSMEQFIRSSAGGDGDVAAQSEAGRRSREERLFRTRWALSGLYSTPVCGVSAWEGWPAERMTDPAAALPQIDAMIHLALSKHNIDAVRRLAASREQALELLRARPLSPSATQGSKHPVPSDVEGLVNHIRSMDWCSGELMVKLGSAGVEAGMLGFFAADASRSARLKKELEISRPDLLLATPLCHVLALQVEWRYDVRVITLELGSAGVVLGDPSAEWMTPEMWPVIQRLQPELAQYASLEEARAKHTVNYGLDMADYSRYVALEEVFTKPLFGGTPIRDIGFDKYKLRRDTGRLVGFLTHVASREFLRSMGPLSRAQVASHSYTGFWLMDEGDQSSDRSAMFGGPDLAEQIGGFLAAGSKPAYIGWGSCIALFKGRHWMCALAVAALMEAKMRGIVLGGWAGLSLALLEEAVGRDDPMGLCGYARDNVLFVDKVPQTWLFSRCSVAVIHGGVGTLAAAWSSGIPTVVVPVWLDQFGNAQLTRLLHAGVTVNPVESVTPAELAGALAFAAASPDVKREAEAMQRRVARDGGVEAAVRCVASHMVTGRLGG